MPSVYCLSDSVVISGTLVYDKLCMVHNFFGFNAIAIKLWEKWQLSFSNHAIELFKWCTTFWRKSHPVKHFAVIYFCWESAYIDLIIQTLTKFQQNRWSRSAEVIRPSKCSPEIDLKIFIHDALWQKKATNPNFWEKPSQWLLNRSAKPIANRANR